MKKSKKEVVVAPKTKTENVSVVVDGQSFIANAREFKSGSRGWYTNGKVIVDGVRCQLGCTIVVIGSKPGSSKKKKEGK